MDPQDQNEGLCEDGCMSFDHIMQTIPLNKARKVTVLALRPKVKMYGWIDFILVPHLKVLDEFSEIFVSGLYAPHICQAHIKQLNNCYATRKCPCFQCYTEQQSISFGK
jgi:hypothetical protein